MPDPKTLKVGDKVVFTSLPEEWEDPGYRVDPDDVAFMEHLIRRGRPSRVCMVCEHGHPWIEARIKERGRLVHHSWAIAEKTGWRKVKARR